jgi:hypothetical protein
MYIDIIRIHEMQITLTDKEISEDSMNTVPSLTDQGHPKTDFSGAQK